jgi:DNA adenine methylase
VFCREDFARLATQLLGLEGSFILSLNDTPGVQDVFAAFEIEAVPTIYSINGRQPRSVQEVIITNRADPIR